MKRKSWDMCFQRVDMTVVGHPRRERKGLHRRQLQEGERERPSKKLALRAICDHAAAASADNEDEDMSRRCFMKWKDMDGDCNIQCNDVIYGTVDIAPTPEPFLNLMHRH